MAVIQSVVKDGTVGRGGGVMIAVLKLNLEMPVIEFQLECFQNLILATIL